MEEKTSLLQVEQSKDDETSGKDLNTDVEIQAARKRLEAALKNIPQEKPYDDVTEEKWKEISKKFKSYKELKEDLKELKLEMKTEAEMLRDFLDRWKISTDDEAGLADKLTLLEDFEFMCHSIDNSLMFISLGGIETVITPSLNQTNVKLLVRSLKTLGVLMQNNQQAKDYVIEKTNIGNYLINVLSKSITTNQLSAALFAYGSLMRNNRKVSSDLTKKGMTVLIEIITNEKSEISLSMKAKALALVDDLLNCDELKDRDYDKLIDNLNICKHLDNYFTLNRNGFTNDIDSADKTISSLTALKDKCLHTWSESPMFRHTILVLRNNFKSQAESQTDVDSKFVYEEIFQLLEKLNEFLYSELKISADDLLHKLNDEL